MGSIHVPDVGHGLAAQIFDYQNPLFPPSNPKMALIDCGKRHDSELACKIGLGKNRPDVFILSHFHSDHYNGLQAAETDSLELEKVYYPRIPYFAGRDKFVQYNIAMAERSYGWRTGSLSADLLRNIKRINRCEFEFTPLYQGREITFGDQEYEVLWPPIEIEKTTIEMTQAIETFEKAREEDEILQEITDEIQEREVISDYRGDQRTYEPFFQNHRVSDVELPIEERELPEVTQRAHKRLRDATDRMSVAFYDPDRILFLGDLKAGELRKVSKDLAALKQTYYDILIAPHHGTRYSTAMGDLEANWTVSSLGKENLPSIDTRIRDLGEQNWATYLDGDFTRPIYSASALKGQYLRM